MTWVNCIAVPSSLSDITKTIFEDCASRMDKEINVFLLDISDHEIAKVMSLDKNTSVFLLHLDVHNRYNLDSFTRVFACIIHDLFHVHGCPFVYYILYCIKGLFKDEIVTVSHIVNINETGLIEALTAISNNCDRDAEDVLYKILPNQ